MERAGIIQFYEMTFELAWKVMKDYLENSGYIIKSPRDAIKQAFQMGIIENGHIWIDALEDRNLTTHTYEESKALEIDEKIRNIYYPIINLFYKCLKNETQ